MNEIIYFDEMLDTNAKSLAEIESIMDDAKASGKNSRGSWAVYSMYAKRLRALNLEPDQFEQANKRLTRLLKV